MRAYPVARQQSTGYPSVQIVTGIGVLHYPPEIALNIRLEAGGETDKELVGVLVILDTLSGSYCLDRASKSLAI